MLIGWKRGILAGGAPGRDVQDVSRIGKFLRVKVGRAGVLDAFIWV